MQDDIGGDLEFVAAVIAGSVHKKQDQSFGPLEQDGRCHATYLLIGLLHVGPRPLRATRGGSCAPYDLYEMV